MKKLCLGTFFKILCQTRAASVKQRELLGAFLSCVKYDSDYNANDDTFQGHLKSGHDNVTSDFATTVRDENPDTIFEYISTAVMPMLDQSKQKQVILAFRAIITEDTYITDTDNLGPTAGYTKADILKKKTFSYVGLITNLFIYCVTQPENKPYQTNIREITTGFVDGFTPYIANINVSETLPLAPMPLDLSARYKDFSAVFDEIIHPHTLSLPNPSQVKYYCLKVSDYGFDHIAISNFIKQNLGRYLFSRVKRNEYAINGNAEDITHEAATALRKRGTVTTTAHFAEIMLYSFLECALGAPKVMSKIELQDLGGTYKSKSSGVHLLSIDGGTTISHQLVFGSTDMLCTLSDAVDSAFGQIVDINSSATDEHQLVESNIMNGAFSPEVTVALKEIIIPQKNKPKRPDTAFGVFLGYNVCVPNVDSLSSEEYPSALLRQRQADILACVPYIQSKIDTLRLSRHSFYIYVLPLNDIETERTQIMNRALGV